MYSGLKTYTCFVCEKQFALASRLEAHISIHTGEGEPFVCFKCDCGFPELGKLTRHMLKHTENESRRCTLCEKPFCRKSSLRSHILRHAHTCISCGKAFDDAYRLKSHIICEKQCSQGIDRRTCCSTPRKVIGR